MIYTFGDSFTHGHELTNPLEDAWPVVLANKLNADVVNFAKPGVDNDFIIETVINSITKNKPNLVIVAWTSAARRQFHDNNGTHITWPGHVLRKTQLHRNQLTKYITAHNNEKLEYCQWLLKVILLQAFLQQHQVNYYFVNTFDNQQRNIKYLDDYKHYADQIDVNRFIGWPGIGIVEWCFGHKLAPGGHPLEKGHCEIAEKIFTFLKQDAH